MPCVPPSYTYVRVLARVCVDPRRRLYPLVAEHSIANKPPVVGYPELDKMALCGVFPSTDARLASPTAPLSELWDGWSRPSFPHSKGSLPAERIEGRHNSASLCRSDKAVFGSAHRTITSMDGVKSSLALLLTAPCPSRASRGRPLAVLVATPYMNVHDICPPTSPVAAVTPLTGSRVEGGGAHPMPSRGGRDGPPSP
jgi:hypothetical protein